MDHEKDVLRIGLVDPHVQYGSADPHEAVVDAIGENLAGGRRKRFRRWRFVPQRGFGEDFGDDDPGGFFCQPAADAQDVAALKRRAGSLQFARAIDAKRTRTVVDDIAVGVPGIEADDGAGQIEARIVRQ